MAPDVSTVDIYHVFRFYSTCKGDPRPWVLDVRSSREFKKSHLSHAYSIRLTADERALLVRQDEWLLPSLSSSCFASEPPFPLRTTQRTSMRSSGQTAAGEPADPENAPLFLAETPPTRTQVGEASLCIRH